MFPSESKLEARECLICKRKLLPSSQLSQEMIKKYPDVEYQECLRVEYRCGYCNTRLISYPFLQEPECWDLWSGPVEENIVKRLEQIQMNRNLYYSMWNVILIVNYLAEFDINYTKLQNYMLHSVANIYLEKIDFENKECIAYFKDNYKEDWQHVLEAYLTAYNELMDKLIRLVLNRNIACEKNVVSDEDRFSYEVIVENGQPHYSVYDSLADKEVSCDMNELKQTIAELKEEYGE